MNDEQKGRGLISNPQNKNYYGTFQGVVNYYPPFPQAPPQQVVGLPQPIPPPGPGYAVVEGRPLGEYRLPCCGIGMGWFLFIIGFFLGGIPWYVGAFIALCAQVDYREKPGYIACAIASVLTMIALTLGVTKGAHTWGD
ncbi:hypothetical protein KPL71_005970 [Citrus sinensis]|uniref:Uncharacterized protein n=1 Tax=Citrus sinensis TaxID=2711 RepID=A0ACB8NIA4_CITSI|nr:hypothetical protein KPL71_005970 [Citrus sinensis]